MEAEPRFSPGASDRDGVHHLALALEERAVDQACALETAAMGEIEVQPQRLADLFSTWSRD